MDSVHRRSGHRPMAGDLDVEAVRYQLFMIQVGRAFMVVLGWSRTLGRTSVSGQTVSVNTSKTDSEGRVAQLAEQLTLNQ